jgi:oxalate decarboxylase/phosphoglucose isomerase-like protein (cupin superfamily)
MHKFLIVKILNLIKEGMSLSKNMKIEIPFKDIKDNYDKKVVVTFEDMKEKFQNIKGVKGNPVLYEVYIRDFGSFETGLTVISSGTINGEYYMTRGHKHKKLRKEMYILVSGKGLLLIGNKKTKIVKLNKKKIYIIPEKAGHRLVNIGNKNLEVLTVYSKDAGHNYSFEFKKRILKNDK